MFLNRFNRGHVDRFAWVLLALICLAGCSRSADPTAYMPQSDAARKAVEAALTAWQQGKPPGEMTVDGVKIDAEDFQWRAKKKLKSFEIVEEATGEPGSRQFRVKIDVAGGKQPEVVIYHVTGKELLWVCRDKDFARPAGM